jgi:hypothetical protein
LHQAIAIRIVDLVEGARDSDAADRGRNPFQASTAALNRASFHGTSSTAHKQQPTLFRRQPPPRRIIGLINTDRQMRLFMNLRRYHSPAIAGAKAVRPR